MFRKTLYFLSDAGAWISGIAIILLMLITVTGIVFRSARIPTTNFYEMITLFGMILFVSGWAYGQKQKAHLRVHIVVSRLPETAQLVIDLIVQVLSVGISSLMVWYSISFAVKLYHDGSIVSQNFPFPLYILVSIIVGFITLFTLALFIELYDSFVRLIKER